MSDNKIAILMPIFNGLEFAEESILSVYAQTIPRALWKLFIIVNGYPEEECDEVVRKLIKITDKYGAEQVYYIGCFEQFEQGRKGVANSLNYALRTHIDGEKYPLIALLDVDDKWAPHKLEKQLKYADRFDVIGTTCKYFGDSDASPYIPVGDIKYFQFLKSNPIINSSALIRRYTHAHIHWDPEWEGIQDYELWLRLRCNPDMRFYNIDDPLTFHRIHGNSYGNKCNQQERVRALVAKYSDKLIGGDTKK
jgi:glycosyltransferase involved in cell wall biosynthesis